MTESRNKQHPYHCVMCGEQLEEVGLGMLACPDCETVYVPTLNDGNASVIWRHVEMVVCEVCTDLSCPRDVVHAAPACNEE